MKLLVIGSGGREHALCWKITQSPECEQLYCSPGNGGAANEWSCPPLMADDFDALTWFAKHEAIDFTIVGPENPLADGIVDRFQNSRLKIFGPTASAALIESDKAFAKELMATAGIPTAEFTIHHSMPEALRSHLLNEYPVVIKVSGLAAGKGVIIAESPREVDHALGNIFHLKKFGEAGSTALLEKFLKGEELSYFVITDGEDFVALPPSQDHKRIGEGDTGPNTGGMGAYAPAPLATPELCAEIEQKIVKPVLAELASRGNPYRGLLYCGVIVTEDGPQALEFNCRFGDPETQAVLPLLKVDLLELMLAAAKPGGISAWKKENGDAPIWDEKKHAACVVLASDGYPTHYEKGFPIRRLDGIYPDTVIFHAGTKIHDGQHLTNGGRVLGITGIGDSLQNALNKAYYAANAIDFSGKYFRRDIGWRALKK